MNSYQKEQLEALSLMQGYLANLALDARQALESRIADYLLFRDDVDAFLDAHFSEICTLKCFKSKISACCVFRRKLPPILEITLPLIPSSNSLVDSNTKVAGLRQLFA